MKRVSLVVMGSLFLVAALIQACGSKDSPAAPKTCAGVFGEPISNLMPNLGTGYTAASSFTLSENAAVTAIAVNSIINDQLIVGIYTNSASAPQSLLGVSNPVTATAAGWVTIGFGPVTLLAGTYWLAAGIPTTSPSGYLACRNTSGSVFANSGMFSNPFVTAFTQSSYHLSVVALYKCQ